jgi:UDP-N-acetylmuramoyl-tripeptide--D-alanyl-D-alanine ligase
MRLDSATEFGVFEMGANHQGEIARMCAVAQPTESAITMIAPAHLEGFGSLDNVARAKGEIMEALSPEGVFYVNSDDAQCAAIGERFAGEKVTFGKKGDVALESCTIDGAGEMTLDVAPIGRLRLPLPLRCHAMNVVLAVAIGLRHGVTEFEGPLRQVLQASSRFKVLRVGPITVLDDTYNASPASVTGALEALADQPGGTRMAVLGEMLELGPAAGDYHRAMGEEAATRGVKRLIVRGEHARDTIAAALAAGMPHAESIEDHRAMAEDIHGAAKAGDVVLVKGSRGMKMERVIEALRNLYGE